MRKLAIRWYCVALLRVHLVLQWLVNPLMRCDHAIVSAAIKANRRLHESK